MKKEEIIKKVTEASSVIVNKFRKEHAAMMAAVWRGDTRARDEHRKVLEGMRNHEVQSTGERLFSWAIAQLKPVYTGGAISYGHARGRICGAPSYAAPVYWVNVEARAVIGTPSWRMYASKEEALRVTLASIGKGNTIKIKVRDRPDPNDSQYSTTTVVETNESDTLDEALKRADPKWGLSDFGPWEWAGEEISAETQAETILLQGESPFRGQWDGHKWEFDIAVR